MAWNEPGNGQKNPWNRNRKSPRKFDLDGVLKQFTSRLGKFGSGSGGLLAILLMFVVAWIIISSFTVIDARQVGVVQQFGRFARVLPPGMHLKAPSPIETVTKVETTQVRSVSDSVSMLTRDENIVSVDFNVQYQVTDARKFLFSNADESDSMMHDAAEAAVRSVVGADRLDAVLPVADGDGDPAPGQAPPADATPSTRETLQQQARDALQATLDTYDAGISVTGLTFQNIAPPKEAKDAFDDVNAAREDRNKSESEAMAYQASVLSEARGQAARIAGDAEADKVERVARANGDAERFNLLLSEYKGAPDVTRRRLWLETMEDILSHNAKIIDGSNGRNIIQLPAAGADTPNPGVRNVPGVGTVVQSATTDATPTSQPQGGAQ